MFSKNNIKYGGVENRSCNCRRGTVCPMGSECLSKQIIYQATVKAEGKEDMIYIGQTKNTFKERLAGHKTSFRKAYKRKCTSLATYIWDLKLESKDWTIEWLKLKECRLYSKGSKRCDLCETEKNLIMIKMMERPEGVLNTFIEFMKPCGHRAREFLSNQLLHTTEDVERGPQGPLDISQTVGDVLGDGRDSVLEQGRVRDPTSIEISQSQVEDRRAWARENSSRLSRRIILEDPG